MKEGIIPQKFRTIAKHDSRGSGIKVYFTNQKNQAYPFTSGNSLNRNIDLKNSMNVEI